MSPQLSTLVDAGAAYMAISGDVYELIIVTENDRSGSYGSIAGYGLVRTRFPDNKARHEQSVEELIVHAIKNCTKVIDDPHTLSATWAARGVGPLSDYKSQSTYLVRLDEKQTEKVHAAYVAAKLCNRV